MDSEEVIALSPEEVAAAKKSAKLEAKKAQKAEKARLKAENMRLEELELQRKQFVRETDYTATTYERASADWERMLVDITHKGAKLELQGLWADVSHHVDRKNNVIGRLTQNIANSRDQMGRLTVSHLKFIEHSINVFQSFSKALRDQYDYECNDMLRKFHSERTEKNMTSGRSKCFFEQILHASNVITDDKLMNLQFDFNATQDEMSNQKTEQNDSMRGRTLANMERLFRQMRATVDATRRTSQKKSRCKKYAALVRREENDELILAQNQADIENMQAVILQLMEERRLAEAVAMHRLKGMRLEKEYFVECFLTLRERYERDMKADQKRMRSLMEHTYNSITQLTEIERKGALILAVTSAARKLQTEEEKVAPWPSNMQESCGLVKYENTHEILSHLSQMEQFWLKVSTTAAFNVALTEEKAHLEEENQRLCNLIRRYCSQDAYNKAIFSLKITTVPTVVLPIQEASHMPRSQLNRETKDK